MFFGIIESVGQSFSSLLPIYSLGSRRMLMSSFMVSVLFCLIINPIFEGFHCQFWQDDEDTQECGRWEYRIYPIGQSIATADLEYILTKFADAREKVRVGTNNQNYPYHSHQRVSSAPIENQSNCEITLINLSRLGSFYSSKMQFTLVIYFSYVAESMENRLVSDGWEDLKLSEILRCYICVTHARPRICSLDDTDVCQFRNCK